MICEIPSYTNFFYLKKLLEKIKDIFLNKNGMMLLELCNDVHQSLQNQYFFLHST